MCSFISLFFHDAWIIANPANSADVVHDSILSSIMGIFIFETILCSYCQRGYLFGFYFYLDIVGTASLILDIGWISNNFSTCFSIGQSFSSMVHAKLGVRYGRLLRFVKFPKYLRYLACFKDKDEIEPIMSALRKVSMDLFRVLFQSVFFLILTLVAVIFVMAYPNTDTGVDAYMDTLRIIAIQDGSITGISNSTLHFQQTVVAFRNFFMHINPIIELTVKSPFVYNGAETVALVRLPDLHLRTENVVEITREMPNGGILKTIISLEIANYWESVCGIFITILIIVIAIMYFTGFQYLIHSKVNNPLDRSRTALQSCATTMLKNMKTVEFEKVLKEEKMITKGTEGLDPDKELDTTLEKLMEKLAGVVQHIVPTEDLLFGTHLDANTLSWLNQSYSNNKESGMSTSGQTELYALKELKSSVSSDMLNSWNFDVLSYTHEELFDVVYDIFGIFDVFSKFKVPLGTFSLFTKEIASRYIENSFHNFTHGCDVLHVVYRLMQKSNLSCSCSSLEIYSLLTAALAHDIGHPGVNNLYLVKSKHKLALRHNDKSPLENMHCAVLYGILGKAEMNIFAGLTENQWRDSRKIILTCILGTDMSHHFEQISKVQVFSEVYGLHIQPFSSGKTRIVPLILRENEQRLFLMEIFLHCADISNPCKPFDLCAKWADLVVFEFCAQGDREKQEGLDISPMMDRNTLNLCNMQMGFIECVFAPLIIEVINIFPSLYEIGQNVKTNLIAWGNRRKNSIDESNMSDKLEEYNKLDERLTNFADKMSFLKQMEIMCTSTTSI